MGLVDTEKIGNKKAAPSINEWLKAAKAEADASEVGMYLIHNGVVRESARSKVRDGELNTEPVVGMEFSYNKEGVEAAIDEALKMDGIFYIKVWLNEGILEIGDDIMYVLIGGDMRPNVIDALQALVGNIKTNHVIEKELY